MCIYDFVEEKGTSKIDKWLLSHHCKMAEENKRIWLEKSLARPRHFIWQEL